MMCSEASLSYVGSFVVSGHTLWHKPALAIEIIGGTGKEDIQFLFIPLPSDLQACDEDLLISRCLQWVSQAEGWPAPSSSTGLLNLE